MAKLLWVILLCPFLCIAQIAISQVVDREDTEGIHFEKGLKWEDVILKAQAENKYIFVDCYTTWCGPCKKMDKTIYPQKSVGNFFNSHFISVKLQMDKTKLDDAFVKSWYATADSLKEKYKVNAYPTYLFYLRLGNHYIGM